MRVLYATDGSTPAQEGGKLIADLFKRDGVNIDVFSVVPDTSYYGWLAADDTELARLDLPPLFDGDEVAREASDRLDGAGFESNFLSTRGDPAHEILRALETNRYDLAVLGGAHTTWMGNVMLGSVSTHVLHQAPCSVLVAHRAPTGSGKVILGMDGSRGSIQAMHLASKVLDPSRCSIDVATVAPYPPVGIAVPYPGAMAVGHSPHSEIIEKDRIERARTLAERHAADLRQRGFDSEGLVLEGGAGPQLLKEADSMNADLVVVGSRGRGPVRRALLGSVSDQLVRHAPATLVARPPHLVSNG